MAVNPRGHDLTFLQDPGAGPGVCSGKPRVGSVEMLGRVSEQIVDSLPVWSVRMPAPVARNVPRLQCDPTCIGVCALSAPWDTQGTFRKGLECVLSGAAGLEDKTVLRYLEDRVEYWPMFPPWG